MDSVFVFFISSSLLFFIWTVFNSLFLPKLTERGASYQEEPLVSILVPMRNEERNAKALLETIQALSYRNWECIILDDQSTDETWRILQTNSANDRRIRLVQGGPLPQQWSGKVHACHQLSTYASGDMLLFLDADVRLAPDTIERSLSLMDKRNAKLLTGFPAFPVDSLLGRLMVPMQQFLIYFHLPLLFANHTKWKSTTAAHGAFMMFEANAYRSIGGHRSVQSSLVEDVHIARAMKSAGHCVLLANITSHVSCYMYETSRETWAGFTKNVFIGLGRSVLLVIGLSIFYGVFYLVPYAMIVFAVHDPVFIIPSILLWLQRLYVDVNAKQAPALSLLFPFSIIMLIAIMMYSMSISLLKKSYYWKGRTYI